MDDLLRVERHGFVERFVLCRPESLNAFNRGLLEALAAAVARVDADLDVRAIVIGGAGKAFSAGADLKERKTMPLDEVPRFVSLIGGTFDAVARCRVPSVAAVDGFAFGGGMELALACDLRVVGPAALMGLTETRLAIIPGAGGCVRLPRLVGSGRAKELILTGRKVGAEEALRIGIAEVIANTDEPADAPGARADDGPAMRAALRVAAEIASGGPVAVQAAKAAIDGSFDRDSGDALGWERACYDHTLGTSDRIEALAAFAERRAPQYRGR